MAELNSIYRLTAEPPAAATAGETGGYSVLLRDHGLALRATGISADRVDRQSLRRAAVDELKRAAEYICRDWRKWNTCTRTATRPLRTKRPSCSAIRVAPELVDIRHATRVGHHSENVPCPLQLVRATHDALFERDPDGWRPSRPGPLQSQAAPQHAGDLDRGALAAPRARAHPRQSRGHAVSPGDRHGRYRLPDADRSCARALRCDRSPWSFAVIGITAPSRTAARLALMVWRPDERNAV